MLVILHLQALPLFIGGYNKFCELFKMADAAGTFITFFDIFCKEVSERLDKPEKIFGTWGSACAGGANSVCKTNAIASSMITLIGAFPYRNKLAPPPSADVMVAQGAITEKITLGSEAFKEQLKTQPGIDKFQALSEILLIKSRIDAATKRANQFEEGNDTCKFLQLAVVAIAEFKVQSTKPGAPVRLADLGQNVMKKGPIGLDAALAAASTMVSDVCETPREKAAIDEIIAWARLGMKKTDDPSYIEGTATHAEITSGGYRKRKTRGHKRSSHKRSNRKTKRRNQ